MAGQRLFYLRLGTFREVCFYKKIKECEVHEATAMLERGSTHLRGGGVYATNDSNKLIRLSTHLKKN